VKKYRRLKKVLVIMNNMKRYITLFLFMLAYACIQTPAADAMVVQWGESFTFEPYTTIDDDIYSFGDIILMHGTTTGDVVAAGSDILQGGAVGQDGMYLGGTIKLDGKIYGDVRGAGGKVEIHGYVKEDVIFAGGVVTIAEDALIDGDVLLAGEHVIVHGTIGGAVKIFASVVEIDGTIGSDVDIHAEEIVSIVGDANIVGTVTYKAPKEAFISETATIDGEVYFTETTPQREHVQTVFSIGAMLYIIISVISAILLLFFFPSQTKTMTRVALSKDVVLHAVIGFCILFLTPLLVVLLMVSVIGIIPALLILSVYMTVLFISLALAPVIASVVLLKLLKKEDKAFEYSWTLLGALVFVFLILIPFLGSLARFIVFVLAFYSVLVVLYEYVWKKRNDEPLDITEKHENKNEDNSEHEG
jgi:cytoskeletal protein CcmA (bactofilin family)